MKITIEQEGKEAKVFETNGIIFVANLDKGVRCARLLDGLSVVDMAELIFALRKMLEETKEQFPEAANLADINSVLKGLAEGFGEDLDDDAANLADINSVLKGLAESFGEDLDDGEEADNDAGRV